MKKFVLLSNLFFLHFALCSQSFTSANYSFELITSIQTSPVKDQFKSGTCWAFAGLSFVESELMRMGKGTFDFSEMYVVRNAYISKAEYYVRLHGKNAFGSGGQAHDVLNVIRTQGLMTESEYPGLNYGTEKHIHGEMDQVLKAILKAVLENKNGELSTAWTEVVAYTLDAYLGKLPQTSKDPLDWISNELKFNPDDYVEITSYSHRPFYQPFALEVPDNWSRDLYYNLPLDAMMETINHALKNNFSICWDGDVSGDFNRSKGLAVLEDENTKIDQQSRQKVFDNFNATDDHLMHITGLAKDQKGGIFYYTKNSWNTNNTFQGYWFMSENYLRKNTVAILLHKDAIPKKIRNKLNI
jgi:bleomycin hydrolase